MDWAARDAVLTALWFVMLFSTLLVFLIPRSLALESYTLAMSAILLGAMFFGDMEPDHIVGGALLGTAVLFAFVRWFTLRKARALDQR